MTEENSLNKMGSTIPISFLPPPKGRRFVGRYTELDVLKQELSRSPVVLVEGLSGIGKTSLVAHYVHHFLDAKNACVFWLECQEGTNIEDLLVAFWDYAGQNNEISFKKAIEEVERPLSDRIHKLIQFLEARSGLLILDGFECADKTSMLLLVQEVLQHSDTFKVIICTRERPNNFMNILINIGEVCLGGLSEADAVKFIQQHNVIEDEELLPKIAQKTEGHPLAIQLFLTLVRAFGSPPSQLLEDSPEFGRSLEEHWLSKIFSRLTDDEQNILENFSVYLDPVPKDAIVSVIPGLDLSHHLQSLQDKFLLNCSKYLFTTHALVREFFYRKLLASSMHKVIAYRAAKFYLSGVKINEYVNDMSAEEIVTKLRAHHYLVLAEQYFEAAQIVNNVKSLLMRIGQTSQLLTLINRTFETVNEEKLNPSQQSEWKGMARWLEYYRGRILYLRGEIEPGLRVFLDLMATQDLNLKAECLQMVANIYLDQGKSHEVIRLLEENIKLFRHNEKKLERVADKAARAYIQLGKLNEAQTILQQLLNWQQAADDIFGGAITLKQLAVVSVAQNDLKNALAFAELSEKLIKPTDDANLYAATAQTLGEIHEKLGNKSTAVKWYECSFKVFTELSNVPGIRQIGEKLLKLYGDDQNALRRSEIADILSQNLLT